MRTHMKTNAQLFCTLSALVNVAVPVLSQTAPASIQAPALQRAAPEPARLPDGKPNWTGFWDLPNGFLEVYRGPAGVSGPNRGGGRAGARGGAVNVPQRRTDIPEMKSPYKERYEALLKQAEAGTLPDPGALCLPQGMPGMMGAIYGMEILQTPKIIAISSEFKAGTRRIWMDATHPADDLDETFTGHSIGRWEGDVLVVDTVGIREDVAMGGRPPLPHSSKLRIVERFRQTAPGTLVDEMTFSDPDVYVASWIEMRTYRYRADLKLQEFVCQENNRNVDPTSGVTTFK